MCCEIDFLTEVEHNRLDITVYQKERNIRILTIMNILIPNSTNNKKHTEKV